jgi:hypothetical protein
VLLRRGQAFGSDTSSLHRHNEVSVGKATFGSDLFWRKITVGHGADLVAPASSSQPDPGPKQTLNESLRLFTAHFCT